MQNIGIITKRSDQRALAATRQLAEWLHERGLQVTITRETAEAAAISEETAACRDQEDLPEGQDLVAVIGGDGTFIAAFRAIGERSVPVLGINMGRLGFLAEISPENMLATMEKILAGHYRLVERMSLTVTVHRQQEAVFSHRVLNDVVIHKGELARMMEYGVSIGEKFVFSTRADGLIVSTPTGSTAYALSAGGPIIHPALDATLLVPICPHTLTNRPIAVPGSSEISIILAQDGLDRLLTLDGQTGFSLEDEDLIIIRRSNHRFRILHPVERNYFAVLRKKLRWGEQAGT